MARFRIRIFERTAQNRSEREFIRKCLVPGLGVAGDEVEATQTDYEECDVAAILWSPRSGSIERERAARKIRHLHSRNLLIIETSVLRSVATWHFRVGFDHVHRGGRFFVRDMPPDRAKAMGIEPQPWKDDGGPVIVAGQLPGDYSLNGVDPLEWAGDVARRIDELSEKKIIFRPHPLDHSTDWLMLASSVGADISRRALKDDLAAAGTWVAFTSGSAIDSVLAGVPTICLSSCNFAWDVSRHGVADISNPWKGDRSQWLANLAYVQWTADEIAAGLTWRHMRELVRT